MERVIPLSLEFRRGDISVPIHPTLIRQGTDAVLVDCGFPSSMGPLADAVQQHGGRLEDLSALVLTHHDHDHMGAACAIATACPNAVVLCSADQAPYITGKEKSLRLQQVEALHDSLPEERKEESLRFQKLIASVSPVPQVGIITPGTVLPYCGGIEVLDTKGHMPGHISLYVKEEKTLIAGDALVVVDGTLCIAHPQYAFDLAQAYASVENLLNYEIERIICYHGGSYANAVKDSLVRIIEGRPAALG